MTIFRTPADIEKYGLKSDFVDLESKYNEWFANTATSINDYFVDSDISNGFVRNCELPEQIKIECVLLKARHWF